MRYIITSILLLTSLNTFGQNEYRDFRKGQFRLDLGLPYLNHLLLSPDNMILINKAGFIGESIGISYSYTDKQFFEFKFSFAAATSHPLPIEGEGSYTNQYSTYFSLSNNHKKDRFIYGYGFNYSINTWAEGFRSFEDPNLNSRSQVSNKALGLTLNSFYQIGKAFNIGLTYRPTYFRLNETLENKYEHLLSLEFLWRIRLNKK